MKIAIFGATGKVGRRLVDQALERGDRVTAFVRDPSKLTTQRHERLKVVQGNVQNPKDVDGGLAHPHTEEVLKELSPLLVGSGRSHT